MNCEEYVVERLQKLEKTNENLKILIDNQTDRIDALIEKIDAFEDLIEKAQLEIEEGECYYGLNFKGHYLTLNNKDKVKSIVNDLKILDLYQDIILEVEKWEENHK